MKQEQPVEGEMPGPRTEKGATKRASVRGAEVGAQKNSLRTLPSSFSRSTAPETWRPNLKLLASDLRTL